MTTGQRLANEPDAAWRRTVRWGATHGLLRALLRGRALTGNPDARLLHDRTFHADPYPGYEHLRTDAPFAASAFFGRLSVHHEVCSTILRSDEFGVVGRDGALPPPVRLVLRLTGPAPHLGPIDPPSMLAVDPPTHTRYRRLVNKAFTAKAVARQRDRAGAVAHELLDELERAAHACGPVDLVGGFAAQLPLRIISDMLGVPPERRADILAWVHGAGAALDIGLRRRQHTTVEDSLAGLNAWMSGHIRERRRTPGDDMISALLAVTDDDGSGLTDEEVGATAGLVLAAGFETTVNLIGNATTLVLGRPDQHALLRAEPDRWTGAVEETLRFDPPVQRTARRAVRDTEVHGNGIAAGDVVVLALAGANRDPLVFDRPATFDVTRPNAREHLAFSGGIHFCLGAALARMEAAEGLHALFGRFPQLTLAGGARRRPTRNLRGYEVLPVHLHGP